MSLKRFGRRVVGMYGADIERMAGGSLSGVSFRFGNTGGFAGTGTTGGGVKVSREWWQGASRKDKRGFLIHELSHVAGIGGTTGANWSDNRKEQTADAIRYALNGAAGINKDTLPEAKRIAEHRGWLGDDMAGPGSNRTGNGRVNRNRNTLINNASKAPVLGPQQALALNQQLQGLQTQYAGARALQQASIAGAKSQGILARQAARSGAVAAMGQQVNDSLSRGVVGGSADLQARAGVISDRNAQLAAANSTQAQAIAAAKANTLSALGDYYLGVGNVASDQAAQQAQMQIDMFQNDMLNTNLSSYNQLLRRLLRQSGNGGGDGPSPGTVKRLIRDATGQVQYGQTPYGKPLY